MPTPAERLAPLLEALLGAELPVRLRCWDGSELGPADASAVMVLRRRRALRTLLWQPDELGLSRAYVSGDLDIDGDMYTVFDVPELVAKLAGNDGLTLSWGMKLRALATAFRLGAVGPRPRLPPEEDHHPRRGRRRSAKHSRARDAGSIRHHYDVGNEFYRLVLGPSLVYSCAYWTQAAGPAYGLEQAQQDKLELICRKLGLQPGMRLLDVGCGWGSLALHAARHHGVRVVGVTLSAEQASLARHRVAEAGLSELVEVRVQDYREVGDGPYDAIASVGMAEHVGARQLGAYCQTLFALLRPGGRLLNSAISSPPSGEEGIVEPRSSFIDRYVFPDGELLPLAMMVDGFERAGFEVRDTENLREHYAQTLRAWVDNLDSNWVAAAGYTSEGRARVWKLYMVGSALGFQSGQIAVNQVLAIKRDAAGESHMAPTRDHWALPAGG